MNHTFMRKAVATCAATGAAASFAVLSAPAQAAPPVPSEPLPSPTSFVVLQAGKGTDKATAAVKAAGGTVVQEWPQIGVVIAHSTKASFRTDVIDRARNSVESVGPTRSVAVSEGTPAGAQAPWGPGKGQLKKARTKQGDVSAGTAATSTDPREGEQWDMAMIKVPQAHAITTGSPDVLVGVLVIR